MRTGCPLPHVPLNASVVITGDGVIGLSTVAPTVTCPSARRSASGRWSVCSSTTPPTHDAAYKSMQNALEAAQQQGGRLVVGGGRRLAEETPDAYYVEPAVVRMPEQSDIVRQETSAPLLYVLPYRTLEEAIALTNDVPQGLSSSIFTSDHAQAERFLAADGSDCGIVNIGTSGAEIGGAFGGEKETGGGRESGSDAWRGYTRGPRRPSTTWASCPWPRV
jgi:acyl-CoA reductase-like NAD-dependent aldehyde dehydrogenase